MDFYMYHGRTDPEGPPQQRIVYDDFGNRIEYRDVDDWGFEGPRLKGVVGIHCTYGVQGHWNLYFESNSAANAARLLTGWRMWDDNALTVAFNDDNSMVKIRAAGEDMDHYFGDWGIK